MNITEVRTLLSDAHKALNEATIDRLHKSELVDRLKEGMDRLEERATINSLAETSRFLKAEIDACGLYPGRSIQGKVQEIDEGLRRLEFLQTGKWN